MCIKIVPIKILALKKYWKTLKSIKIERFQQALILFAKRMATNIVKFLRAENKRLLSLVSKLTGTIETIHFQLEQKEDTLAKRRVEVATLHEACAKYKRARDRPVQLPIHLSPAVSSSISSFTIPLNVIHDDLVTNDSGCLRCEKAKDIFGELRVAMDAFAEKLSTAFAAKEAQFEERLSTAKREKDSEIEKLAASLAKKKRKEEERRQRIERQKDESKQEYEDTMRQMAEMEAQQQVTLQHQLREIDERHLQQEREAAQRLRRIDEEHLQRVHAIQQRAVVQSRQRRGVADAA